MDRIIKKKKWTPKKIAIYSIAALFVLFVGYTFLFGDYSSKLNVKKERLTISTVTAREFQERIPITATVIPIKTVYLDALEGGRVDEIYAEAGEMVKLGDPIVRLENTNLRLNVMQQQASMLDQSNELRNTRLKMDRQKIDLYNKLADLDYEIKKSKRTFNGNQMLLENKIISRQEYEDSKDIYDYNLRKKELAIESAKYDSIMMAIQIDQLAGSLRRLQENLQITKQRLENLTIAATASGQLTSLNAEYTGEIKTAGERIGQIDVLDGFKIRAGIDEHYLPRVDIGQTAEFEFSSSLYELKISKIFPEITDGRFNIDLVFTDEVPAGIRRGLTVHPRLALGGLSEQLTIDRGGFFQETGGQWIYVVNGSGDLATKRDIQIGRRNTEFYEVLEGLEEGEKVITSSYENYGDAKKLILK
ncbi:HlyD family efflux transporter periplasmic adaptor subunit [candidate division KSB1 bacterium]|nr:HlyD family efflux transporter periplasmic adaptor subunit [candidate division KSB1 bacterium]